MCGCSLVYMYEYVVARGQARVWFLSHQPPGCSYLVVFETGVFTGLGLAK